MPTDWGSVTSGAGGLTPAQQAALAAARTAATNAAANAARQIAQQAAGATVNAVVAGARVAAQNAWRGVTGSAAGYRENEPTILRQAANAVQDVASIVTYNAIPSSSQGVISRGVITTSEALEAGATEAAQNLAPLGLGILAGSGGVILIGGAVLLAIVLLKR